MDCWAASYFAVIHGGPLPNRVCCDQLSREKGRVLPTNIARQHVRMHRDLDLCLICDWYQVEPHPRRAGRSYKIPAWGERERPPNVESEANGVTFNHERRKERIRSRATKKNDWGSDPNFVLGPNLKILF